jgi:hypothetical protein
VITVGAPVIEGTNVDQAIPVPWDALEDLPACREDTDTLLEANDLLILLCYSTPSIEVLDNVYRVGDDVGVHLSRVYPQLRRSSVPWECREYLSCKHIHIRRIKIELSTRNLKKRDHAEG